MKRYLIAAGVLALTATLAACDDPQPKLDGSCTNNKTNKTYPMKYDQHWNQYTGRVAGFKQTLTEDDSDEWTCRVEGDPSYDDEPIERRDREVLDV